MSDKPRILYVSDAHDGCQAEAVENQLRQTCQLVEVHTPIRALARLAREQFSGIYVMSEHFRDALRLGNLLQNERILDSMPDGVALLDADNTIIWANQRMRQWCENDQPAGQGFYAALGSPEILGPDYCPFRTALAMGQPSSSTLRSKQGGYFHVHAAPVIEDEGLPENLIVTVRDVTTEVYQRQKLDAIHKAGIALADLTTTEVFQMEVEERIELVKSNILHYTMDLLKFDVVEIRLLNQNTNELEPLLAVGIDSEAAQRHLTANTKANGVTGFVAATGKSYLCEDTASDPLYLEGCKGAKSSLTVPLLLHDQVIGTFNVESPELKAFSESDMQFLEIFARDMAVALNTLELLVAQKANAAQESIEAIHAAVAQPVDEILNDAVNVMELFIGLKPDVVQRLQRILRNARDIKQVIHKVGQKLAPVEALPSYVQVEQRPKLRSRRVLVVDEDDSVRNDAHALLERYGCIVETAHEGSEAALMVRNCDEEVSYDAIIADVRLPDMNGYEFLCKLKTIIDPVPLILMTGFGYDPTHSIPQARKAGLQANAVLYKPFRLDQLLETVESLLDAANAVT